MKLFRVSRSTEGSYASWYVVARSNEAVMAEFPEATGLEVLASTEGEGQARLVIVRTEKREQPASSGVIADSGIY